MNVHQRAESGGVGSVVVGFRVLGAPRFSVQRSPNTYLKEFSLKKRQIQLRWIQPPILGHLSTDVAWCLKNVVGERLDPLPYSFLLLGMNVAAEKVSSGAGVMTSTNKLS